MTQQDNTISTILTDLGLTIESKFVPFSQSRSKNDKYHNLNWLITLVLNGKPLLTTDYTKGQAYCPSYKINHGRVNGRQAMVNRECEIGFQVDDYLSKKLGSRPIEPDLTEVMACLVLDSNVLDYPDFESWSCDYGYDVDSRRAYQTYINCLDTALKLRNSLGERTLSTLKELFADY